MGVFGGAVRGGLRSSSSGSCIASFEGRLDSGVVKCL